MRYTLTYIKNKGDRLSPRSYKRNKAITRFMMFVGLSQWYPFCSVQMIEAIQVATSTLFSDLEEDIMLENKIIYISRNVFACMMATEEDSSVVMNICDFILRGVVFNTVGILEFGGYRMPLPPPSVGKSYL